MSAHKLRHGFASKALALGASLSKIGSLLDHNEIDATARYAHLPRDSIKASPTATGRVRQTKNPFDGRSAWCRVGRMAIVAECARRKHAGNWRDRCPG